MNMCGPSRPPMSRIVMPSAISRMTSTAAAELVSRSLTSRPPRRRPVRTGSAAGRSASSVMAGLQQQGEGWAGGLGAAGELDELRRDRVRVDDRVAPVVEADVLGQQLGAQPVAVAHDRIDADGRAPGHAAARAA